ncbi:hypothetical protein Mal33_40800 [Rosistilla oblonga]|uniref:Bacterial Ig-like domain (Group 2) n=2 Tax=Rosistilla oblonga TaxID=2527990 RepID=A0A518IY94_9BACT|nr:DUF1549 and DUF1553 domain-containing protein [Rosistilla oblonga]QDV58063.1 hypothetical protein Mal33_40800 [Rosistilla oblonga]
MMRRLSLTLSAVLLSSAIALAAEPAAPAAATSGGPAPTAEVNLSVYPEEISLDTARDYQNFIAVVRRDDDVTLDVTETAKWTLADDKVAKLDGTKVTPLAEGATELVCNYGSSEIRIPVKVTRPGEKLPISFEKDIVPIMTRSGCNTGSCHGAKIGKDGFMISLFGYDPAGDYSRITREIGMRRINLAVPADSLFLTKATGAVTHTGGKLFDKDSVYYATILEWLENGAPNDATPPPAVSKLEIYPPQAVIEGAGSKQKFIAVAHYDDGTTRDVSNLAAFMTNNETSAAIDNEGNVTAGARGEAFIMARFETKTEGRQVIVLPENLKYEAPQITGNYIDQSVGKKLNQLRILPSGLCTDEEFLRRITLDITGQMPTEEEYQTFMNDTAPQKRSELIDRLLERKEFSEIWAMKFAQLLMIKSSNQVSYKSAFLYNQWLTDKFARNVPIDQMVRELLGATGGTFSSPATNYYQIETDTLKRAENVAQVFMGIRTQCAQCHNHPFDRWTQNDYYSFAAFFCQVGSKGAEDYRERIIYNRGSGEVKHVVTNKVSPPKFLGGEFADTKGKDRRVVLAEWLTSPENPYFATSIANRVWAHFMGVGIVEPVDDVRISNPASNQELFELLGTKLAEYKFDFRQLVRDICNSEAYQRSATSNESNKTDTRNFAYATVRRIPAEMLLDCISQVTNTKEKFRGLPLGARAVQIADGRTSTFFLTTFGRAPRDTVCDCEASTDPSLSQALHLLNSNTTNGKITQGKVVDELLAGDATPEQALERLYIRCLARKPTDAEKTELLATVAKAPSPKEGLEDIFWALLNSREFVFNH